MEFSLHACNRGAGTVDAKTGSPDYEVRHGPPTPGLAQEHGNTVYGVAIVASLIKPSLLINWTDYW